MNENDYLNFKYLLEYFVSHLEWIVNNDTSFVGYKKYIEPRLQKNEFKITGQGYNGGRIQEQISDWDHFEGTQVCINITYNQMIGYHSKFCYLNWLWTGVNIIAEWEDKRIVGLYQELFIEKKKPERSIWKSLNMSKSIQELGLFDNSSTTNSVLKSFYKNFRAELLQHNLREQHKKKMAQIEDKIKLLKYKKQIILQGPPGTGKTREAKLIAKELIGNNSKISEKNIFSFFTINQEISARKESTKYIIKEINQDSILLSTNGEDRSPTRKQIYDSYIGKLWEKSSEERKSNTLSYADALAKNLFNRFNDLKNNDQIKLIQFHPSYTYEDFVRGIVAESKGEKIEYKNVNKTLGEFAELALKNYHKSIKSDSLLSKNEWVNEQFDNFVETVQSKIDDTGEYRLTDKVKLFDIDESAFYYTGDSWFDSAKHRMKFSDIKEAFLSDPADKKAFKALANISGSAKQHYGYYYKVFSDFKNSITTKFKEVDTVVREPENFVLIIDEINRANLSSVLGELIYALEYRGEEVESMYSVDDSLLKNKLILPPNLYIIGTMNTADRSVGHIDYAIRRRFAFVDVLPKELLDDEEIYFNTTDFNRVSALFNETNVSKEFEIDAVQIGHSYFIVKKEDAKDEAEKDDLFRIKMDYEIKPILLEYERDGILIGEYEGKKIREYIKSL